MSTSIENITFLAPFGSTFSHEAWNHFVELFNAPNIKHSNYLPAVINGEILDRVIGHGGYGAVAIAAQCKGKLSESLEPFGQLLQRYPSNEHCPFTILGAVELRLHFCLMSRHDVSIKSLLGVIAHPVALEACKNRIEELSLVEVKANSNGAAARLVSTKTEYTYYAALGPYSATKEFNLQVLEENVETEPAFTTFALVGPKKHSIHYADRNQALIIFSPYNGPGSLAGVLDVFSHHEINLSYIESIHVKDSEYNFLICVELSSNQILLFNRARTMLENRTKSNLVFGPFPVIPR